MKGFRDRQKGFYWILGLVGSRWSLLNIVVTRSALDFGKKNCFDSCVKNELGPEFKETNQRL